MAEFFQQWVIEYGLWGLFASAFISSTLMPGGSELALLYLDSQQLFDPLSLLITATIGNTLGGMSSWLIGWYLSSRTLDEKKYRPALMRIRRWGAPALLLSWLPLIGDPLCLVAGWLRLSFVKSLFFIALGKLLRYVVVLSLV